MVGRNQTGTIHSVFGGSMSSGLRATQLQVLYDDLLDMHESLLNATSIVKHFDEHDEIRMAVIELGAQLRWCMELVEQEKS